MRESPVMDDELPPASQENRTGLVFIMDIHIPDSDVRKPSTCATCIGRAGSNSSSQTSLILNCERRRTPNTVSNFLPTPGPMLSTKVRWSGDTRIGDIACGAHPKTRSSGARSFPSCFPVFGVPQPSRITSATRCPSQPPFGTTSMGLSLGSDASSTTDGAAGGVPGSPRPLPRGCACVAQRMIARHRIWSGHEP
jgi:hypothetical protein